MFKIAIFIGRFQPFHNGHLFIANKALEIAEKLVFLCGSANINKSFRNPWNFQERNMMIESIFYNKKNVVILPLNDEYTDELWLFNIKNTLYKYKKNNYDNNRDICTIGHVKDYTSHYLNFFNNFIKMENFHNINSSDIRNELKKKEKRDLIYLKSILPNTIFNMMKDNDL